MCVCPSCVYRTNKVRRTAHGSVLLWVKCQEKCKAMKRLAFSLIFHSNDVIPSYLHWVRAYEHASIVPLFLPRRTQTRQLQTITSRSFPHPLRPSDGIYVSVNWVIISYGSSDLTTSTFPKLTMTYSKFYPLEKGSMNLNQNIKILCQERTFLIVVCTMPAILSSPRI